jgi:hypothetical protein
MNRSKCLHVRIVAVLLLVLSCASALLISCAAMAAL